MSEQEVSNVEAPNIEAPSSIDAPIDLEAAAVEESTSLHAPTDLEAPIIAALHTCFDPEIPVDIYELGLIYGIDVQPSGEVNIKMTLTSPGCPVAGSLPGEVEEKVRSVPGVTAAKVELVWDPPWGMEKMSEAAKLQLGMF
ncbi:MAG: SUF system Fe-S cluster assembly protein [Acidobacteriota bacterium]